MTTKKQIKVGTIALLLFFFSKCAYSFHSAVGQHQRKLHHGASSAPATTTDLVDINNASSDHLWATNALLFSSWTDGIVPNPAAKSFLKYSIAKKLLQDHINEKENRLESSVKFSPCNGLNVDALNNLETADGLSKRGKRIIKFDAEEAQEVDSWVKEILQYIATDAGKVSVKLLYIPTAMYALNPKSSNTPGKQRQRARADGKKRRTQVMSLLQTLLSEECPNNDEISVQTITLDLDDDSLKQPEGPEMSQFPKSGKEALSSSTVIYVEGGNTFWLQHCIEKGNYSQSIIDACTGEAGAVYCGKSAGAIVAGDEISTATWKGWDDPSVVPSKETYDDWIGVQGFHFAENLSFFPHMSEDWTELVQEKMKGMESSNTCCLEENQVCCINGESMNAFVVSGLLNDECNAN